MAMAFTIDWRVVIAVPVILYKIGRVTAGIVASAISFPVLGMARRHAQIKRLIIYARMGVYNNRIAVYQPWLWVGVIADVDTTVKSGLTDTDRNTNISSQC
jgi:hypothetical protein